MGKILKLKIMAHYVCPVCGGVADEPKSCETPGCAREGQPLVECNCADGMHKETKQKAE